MMHVFLFFVLTFPVSSRSEVVNSGEEQDYLSDAISTLDEEDQFQLNIETVGSAGGFKKKFNKLWATCGNGCTPVTPWFKGDKRHCKLKEGSCHNSVQAVDIHTVNCKGEKITGDSRAGRTKFTAIVNCMERNGAQTIWQTAGHYGHFHVQFPGCHKKVGCGRSRSAMNTEISK